MTLSARLPVIALLGVLAVGVSAPPALADEAPAAAPVLVASAVDGTPGALALTWAATDGATAYDVAVDDVHQTVEGTSLSVAGLADNTAYDVSVAALSGTGPGPAAHATALTVPAAPQLAATPGDGGADLMWTAPDGLTGFELDGQPLDAAARSSHVDGLPNGQPASLALVALNAGGRSAPAVVSVVPRAPAELTVLAQPAATTVYGTPTVVRAGLSVRGAPVPGEVVQLLARTATGSTVLTSARTDAHGSASLSAVLSASTTLVLRHPDSAVSAPDAAPRSVRVSPRLFAVRAPTGLRQGALLTARGTLSPARPVGAVVQLQRRTSHGWVGLANGRMTTGTTYAVAWRPTVVGSYALRVVTTADASRAAGASPSWTLAVRRENAQDVARDILADRSIVLEDFHAGGPTDAATPLAEIRAVAAGRLAPRSSYGTAPGGSTALDLRLLKALRRMGQLGSVRVSEIAGGSHAGRSQHYLGKAIDISWVDGQHVTRGSSYSLVLDACQAYGVWRVFHPSYDPYGGHSNHVHCDWS